MKVSDILAGTGMLLLCGMSARAQTVVRLNGTYPTAVGASAQTFIPGCLGPDPVTGQGTVAVSCGSGSPTRPGPVTFAAPNAGAIVTANLAVTVFTAGSVTTGCVIVNPVGNAVLYVDMAQTAAAGQSTSFPVQPGQQWMCPGPPTGIVSAVAAQAQSFSAVRY